MPYQFVENDKIDGAARKLIRRHVMKGKNAGKIRMRPTRNVESEELLSLPSFQSFRPKVPASTLSTFIQGDATEISRIPWTIGGSFSLLTFPCQKEPHMGHLIHQCEDAVPVSGLSPLLTSIGLIY